MESSEQLKITHELADKIRAHGVETYPYECCGALIGRDTEGASLRIYREIHALHPLRQAWHWALGPGRWNSRPRAADGRRAGRHGRRGLGARGSPCKAIRSPYFPWAKGDAGRYRRGRHSRPCECCPWRLAVRITCQARAVSAIKTAPCAWTWSLAFRASVFQLETELFSCRHG